MESFWDWYIGVSTPKEPVLREIVNVLKNVLKPSGGHVRSVDENNGVVEGTINQTLTSGTKNIKIHVTNQPNIIPPHPYGSAVYIKVSMNEADRGSYCLLEGLSFSNHLVDRLRTQCESFFVSLAPFRKDGEAYDPPEDMPTAFPPETYKSFDGIAYPPPIGQPPPPPPLPREPSSSAQFTPQPSSQVAAQASESRKEAPSKIPKFCYSCGTPFGERVEKVKFCPACGEKID